MSRLDKVNHQLKREISIVIQRELGDPRLGFVTIVEVKTSPDLRTAKVFYSVLGDAKQVQSAKTALESARGMIRRLIGQRITIRFTPEFTFYYDQTLEKSARIEQALQEIKNEFGENQSDNS